jgi:hypothetical protein
MTTIEKIAEMKQAWKVSQYAMEKAGTAYLEALTADDDEQFAACISLDENLGIEPTQSSSGHYDGDIAEMVASLREENIVAG